MNALIILIPAAIGLGLLALAGFFWAIRSNQYDDLDGDAWRVLLNDDAPPDPPA
jgi:cbb3-type cytochrome oxidase maturation protein